MNICSKVTDTQKNYSTIIIITIYPLSERDYNRFGIDTFLKHGYLVKILDLCLLFTQKYADIVIPNLKEYEAYKQIPNINELSSELCNYSSNNCLIIIYCNILYKSLKIYKEIKKYSFDYAIVNLGNLPKPKYRESKKIPFDSAKIKRCIKLLSVRAICDKLLTFLPNKYYWVLGISPAKYLMIGGANALKVIPGQYISDKTTIINAHSMDYDRYLEMYTSSSSDKIVISKYCVFIDEYFPYHPDYTVNGEQSPCSEERYYPALNSFFDYIEKKFSVKVIIAAHPRAEYNLHPNAYPHRTVISGKTNYLVRDAEFVIMHSSTAISYAVLFKKPIIFLTTDEMKNNYGGLYDDATHTFARCLGQTPINIDGNYSSLCEIPKINDKLYEKYINDYIKIKNSPEKKIWDIFINEIEKG